MRVASTYQETFSGFLGISGWGRAGKAQVWGKIMQSTQKQGFTKYEAILGLGLIAVALLLALPTLRQSFDQDRPLRAVLGAETIAQAVLDYHTDTGQWPPVCGSGLNLACLTSCAPDVNQSSRKQHLKNDGVFATMVVGNFSAGSFEDPAATNQWLEEVPLDPWGNPFWVQVRQLVGGVQTGMPVTEPEIRAWLGKGAASAPQNYPTDPPPGVAIIVLSAGPNGSFETDPSRLNILTAAQQPASGLKKFAGDDLGFVLASEETEG
jgi:type II secretory pathway pseudopilin PulG